MDTVTHLLLLLLLLRNVTQCWCWVGPAVDKTRVVYPFRTDSRGHVISPDVSSSFHPQHHNGDGNRFKREDVTNSSTSEEKLYIVINNDNEELFLKLTPNTNLVTPYTVIEWVLEDGSRILKRATGDCFYIGRLKSTRESLVAISNCDGLTGYIQTQNDSYFIEPLKRREAQDEVSRTGPQPHLIYKVQSITSRLNLSLQQDQEYDHQPHRDSTVPEVDESLRKRRVARFNELRMGTSKILADAARERLKRSEKSVPKFRRERIPKFARTSGSLKAERRSRSAALKTPKFDRRLTSRDSIGSNTLEEDEVSVSLRQHRHAPPPATHTPPPTTHTPPPTTHTPLTVTHTTTNRRNKIRKKDCRRNKTEEGNRSSGTSQDLCEEKPSRREDREERARKRQERRDQKRREREERRKEKERRKQERKRKKEEKKKHKRKGCHNVRGVERGGRGDNEAVAEGAGEDVMCQARKERRNNTRKHRKKEKDKSTKTRGKEDKRIQSGDSLSSSLTEDHPQVLDPFEGLEWDGYSPDIWESQVAAGTSGLTEVTLGDSLNVTDPQKWLELVVAVDNTVIDFHGEDEVEKYVFTLFNI
ncbi:hypothetical protein OTU49_009554, partial [Cherax quadricarinatus]